MFSLISWMRIKSLFFENEELEWRNAKEDMKNEKARANEGGKRKEGRKISMQEWSWIKIGA